MPRNQRYAQTNVADTSKIVEHALALTGSSHALCSVEAKINGTPMTVHLDPGSTRCIIAEKVMRKYGWNINISNAMVKTVNNALIEAIGETDELMLNIQGVCQLVKFLVLNQHDHNALIGLSWFFKTGASLHPSQGIQLGQTKRTSIKPNWRKSTGKRIVVGFLKRTA